MADNSYAQLIDDFEKGLLVIKGESLTDYIKRMGGVDYDAKANGGLMYLKKGGKVVDIMPKSMSWKGKAKDYPGIHEVIKQNRKKKTGPGVQKKANGGIMGYAIGGNIINQDINKYQNIDNQRAEVLQQDINASKGRGFKAQDLDTLKSIEFVNPTLTEFELQGLKDGSITKPGSYSKPQARLTNEEYLSRNNNLTANANNIGRDFTFDTTSPVPEDIDMQYTVGNEFNVKPQQTMFEKARNYAMDTGASIKNLGTSLAGKAVGLPGVNFAINALGKMDRFDTLNNLDKNFILDQSGGNRPSKDPFGINTRSAFGNYGAYVDNLYEKDKDKVYDPVTQKFLYDRKVFNDKLATKRAADLFIAQQEATAAKERAANVEFQRLAAANRARDESSGTGGVGETVDGTFGSSVNNSSTFSDYS